MKRREQDIHLAVAKYIKYQHPRVLFNSDMSGVKMGLRQSVVAKSLRSISFKMPDLQIMREHRGPRKHYNGLMIEIKDPEASGVIYSKKDQFIKHADDQRLSLLMLDACDYCATFGIGTQHCMEIIETYLSGNTEKLHKLIVQDAKRYRELREIYSYERV